MGIASSDELKHIEDKAMKEIEDAVKFTEESPYPDPEEAFKDVFIEEYY